MRRSFPRTRSCSSVALRRPPTGESRRRNALALSPARHVRRQLLQLRDVASAEDDVVRFERGDQARHDVGDVVAAISSCRSAPGRAARRSPRRLPSCTAGGPAPSARRCRRRSGRAEPGAQAQEQHLPALVAAQRLHGGVVDDLDRTTERRLRNRSRPSRRPRLCGSRHRPAMQHRPGVADRHRIVFPVRRQASCTAATICPGVRSAPGRKRTCVQCSARWPGS